MVATTAFMFYVLRDNVLIFLFMCICRIIIKGCLLTYVHKIQY